MRVLVTGSSGLIGSEAVRFFDALGFDITGVDNNMRADFFGPKGDTRWNREQLESQVQRSGIKSWIFAIVKASTSVAHGRFEMVIHAARNRATTWPHNARSTILMSTRWAR